MSKAIVIVAALLIAPRAIVAPEAQANRSLRLYIARHGETDWNVLHRLQGWTDRPLNEMGRRQAVELADTLKGIRLDAIYSSTLSRSRDTARTVAGTTIAVNSLDGLRERNYGHYQGGSDTAPEYLRRSNDWADRLDDGESLNQLLARSRESLTGEKSGRPVARVLLDPAEL